MTRTKLCESGRVFVSHMQQSQPFFREPARARTLCEMEGAGLGSRRKQGPGMSGGEAVESWETGGEAIEAGLDAARERLAAEERKRAERIAKAAAELKLAEEAVVAAAATDPEGNAGEGNPFAGKLVKIMRRPESGASLERAEAEAEGLGNSASAASLPLEERERRYAEARMRIFGATEAGDASPAADPAEPPPTFAVKEQPRSSPTLDEGASPKDAALKSKKKAAKAKKKASSGNGTSSSPEKEAPPPPTSVLPSVSNSSSGGSPPSRTRVALQRRPLEPDIPPDFVRSRPLPGAPAQPTFQGRPLQRPPRPPSPHFTSATTLPPQRLGTVDLTRPQGPRKPASRGAAGFAGRPSGPGDSTTSSYATYGAPPAILAHQPQPLLSLPFPPSDPRSSAAAPFIPQTATTVSTGQPRVVGLPFDAAATSPFGAAPFFHPASPARAPVGPYPRQPGPQPTALYQQHHRYQYPHHFQ